MRSLEFFFRHTRLICRFRRAQTCSTDWSQRLTSKVLQITMSNHLVQLAVTAMMPLHLFRDGPSPTLSHLAMQLSFLG